jgi:hypothetical protein
MPLGRVNNLGRLYHPDIDNLYSAWKAPAKVKFYGAAVMYSVSDGNLAALHPERAPGTTLNWCSKPWLNTGPKARSFPPEHRKAANGTLTRIIAATTKLVVR